MILDLAIIQPIDLCNLNCSYCYLPGRRDPKIMSDDVLEASISCIFNSSFVKPLHDEEWLTFVWHSGEPLAAPIAFYKKAILLMNKYNINRLPIKNEVQTNATLINNQWCDFFIENKFNVGVSIDGPEFLHDRRRKYWNGKGSFKKVMNGINKLKEYKLPLQAICVLSKESLNYPYEIYNFFKENDFNYLAFNIDEVECSNKTSSMNSSHAITESIIEYKNFMSSVYDLWVNDNKKIYIREFVNLTKTIKSKKQFSDYKLPSTETLPFAIISITKDGNITTFSPEMSGGITINKDYFSIGNVLKIKSLDELVTSQRFLELKKEIFDGVTNCSQECEYFDLCGGGAPSNKFYERGSLASTETTMCIFTKKSLIDLLLEKLQATREYQASPAKAGHA